MRGKEKSNFIFIDIHCHVLPELDDGAKNREMALEMLAHAEEQGTCAVIATPHYKQHAIHVPPEMIAARVLALEEEAEEAGIAIKLYAGNELYFHHELDEMIEEAKVCTMAGTSCVLTEFSPTEQYVYIRNAVDSLSSAGYQPIIAHAERYLCLDKHLDRLEELKSMGALIQLNAGSITGITGRNMQKTCKAILKRELADFIATDAHRSIGNRDTSIAKCAQLVYKKYGAEYADKLFWQNARELLNIEA